MEKLLPKTRLAGLSLVLALVGCDDTHEATVERAKRAEAEAREELLEAKQELLEAKQEIQRLEARTSAKADQAADRARAEMEETTAKVKEELQEAARAVEQKVDQADKAVAGAIRGNDPPPSQK